MTEFEPTYCDRCGDELEVGQVGLCGDCIEAARIARKSPANRSPKGRVVNVGVAVHQDGQRLAVACSKTMAKRIAVALNNHKPNREGV